MLNFRFVGKKTTTWVGSYSKTRSPITHPLKLQAESHDIDSGMKQLKIKFNNLNNAVSFKNILAEGSVMVFDNLKIVNIVDNVRFES